MKRPLALGSVMSIARKHLTESGNGSDRFCFNEMNAAFVRGDPSATRMWAIKSLQHSVGIFHPDYRRVTS